MIEHKHRPLLEVKTSDTRPGWFKARVAVFGNVDDGGDRIVKGAFADDIKARGGVYPVVWSHDWQTVPIGRTTSATETDAGLEVEGELLIDDNAKAREVWAAFKAGVPLEFSFAYDTTAAQYVEEDGKEIRELLGLKAHEVGPTLIGMNRETELIAAKFAAGAKVAAEAAAALAETAPTEPAPTPAPEPEPEPTPVPDPPAEPEEPGLTSAQFADAARYLATPV